MDIPSKPLSPGAIINAHAITLSETMNALLNARAEAGQAESERDDWRRRAELAEAKLENSGDTSEARPARRKKPGTTST